METASPSWSNERRLPATGGVWDARRVGGGGGCLVTMENVGDWSVFTTIPHP